MEVLLGYLSEHAALAYAAVFLGAFLEAAAVVGTVIPGSSVVFVGGMLAGAGVIHAWLCAGIAVLGAVLGDGFSYELGHHYRDRIYATWPVSRFPKFLRRGAAFVQRHGAWSILLGRFAGPVRAIVPVIAGMSGLNRTRFYAWNVASALAWVSAHLIPGVVLGASIQLAGAVSSRLLALALVMLVLLWVAYTAIRVLLASARGGWKKLSDRLLRWAGTRDGLLPKYLRSLLDERKAEAASLALSAMLLLAAAWGFFAILDSVVSNEALVHFDRAAYGLAQSLRSPGIDAFFVTITELGDTTVAAAVSAAVLAYLLWRRSWASAAYWAAAIAFAEVAVAALKHILARGRPSLALETYSFPSGHATLSLVVYGFLAYLLLRQQPRALRIAGGLLVGAFVGLVSLSRIYLGVHWFSDVLAGLALGLSWILLLSIAHRHHAGGESIRPVPLAVVVAAALALSGGFEVARLHGSDMGRYAYQPRTQVLAPDEWRTQEWQSLPAARLELDGDPEEPFAIQWADGGEHIHDTMARAGWSAPVKWSARAFFNFLAPRSPIAELPVLPRMNQGAPQSLAFQKLVAADRRVVLRLWRTSHVVAFPNARPGEPVWLGTVGVESIVRRRSVLSLRDEQVDPLAAIREVAAAAKAIRLEQAASQGRSAILVYPSWE